MANDAVVTRTILADERVAGHVVCFVMDGKPHVGYWIGREFWGQGVATRALTLFLEVESRRPLHALAASDNTGSLRVLEKCGFTICGEDCGFANARGAVISEVLLRLDT